MFSLNIVAASTFAGLPSVSIAEWQSSQTYLAGFGSFSKLCTLVNTAATSYVGLHLFCRISKHSSPLA